MGARDQLHANTSISATSKNPGGGPYCPVADIATPSLAKAKGLAALNPSFCFCRPSAFAPGGGPYFLMADIAAPSLAISNT